MKKIKVLLLVFIFWADIFAQDLFKNKFNYSQIISVPDLSFIKQVYTGLDILEQMDFRILENKTIFHCGENESKKISSICLFNDSH